MIKGTILKILDTANDYDDQNQIKDIAKGGLVTETTFNLDSPRGGSRDSVDGEGGSVMEQYFQ